MFVKYVVVEHRYQLVLISLTNLDQTLYCMWIVKEKHIYEITRNCLNGIIFFIIGCTSNNGLSLVSIQNGGRLNLQC